MSAGRRNGPARRAVVRWALRLLRREWRQHVLVITLIATTVAAALFGATTAYNLVPSHDGRFGLANFRFEINVDDQAQFDQFVSDVEAWFGDAEVITHRSVRVPGSTAPLDIRSQHPNGVLGAPMLGVVDGRFPTARGEIALTDGSADLLHATIGDVVDVGTGQATVVGIVENPDELHQEFALTIPAPGDRPSAATILVDADDDQVDGFVSSAAPTGWSIEPRGSSERTAAAIGVLVAATIAMLLVTLVAAAAFVAIAQRRQRQLGLLAAAGATESDVRRVMVATGGAVGVTAAIGGAALAFTAWAVAVPLLETAGGRRIDIRNIPGWVVVTGLILAVATSVAAAWWPARTVARQPIMSALSGRPQPPRRARRFAVAAPVLLIGGVTSLALAIDPSKDRGSVPLALAGVVATTLGLVLLAPPAVRLAGVLARRAPLAGRLALRDLARYQSRSGAALAATSLGLAIAVSIVVIAAANEAGADGGNLSSRQVLVQLGDPGDGPTLFLPEISQADLSALEASVEAWATTLGGDTRVVPLEAAIDPTVSDRIDGRVRHPTVVLGIPLDENTTRDAGLVYIASPALLEYLSVDPASIDAETTMLSAQASEVTFTGEFSRERGPTREPVVQHIEGSAYTSVPDSLMTELGLETGGWEPAPAGWLIESGHPISDAELSAARDMAVASGLTIEGRDPQAGLETLRTTATLVGVAVALAILAMSVGLIRAESARDVRTLAAVGASSRTRRAVTACTAAALAVLAVILGMTSAYAAVYAGYTPATERLDNIPVGNLLAIAVGFPLIAGGAGWILSRREPSGLGRAAIE
jgi:putative ABC transport system permease protein